MSKRIIDLTGQRFGKLVVAELYGTNKDGVALWICKCDCGGTKVARSANLRKGYTKSCGCINRNDLTGQRFGRLVVLEKCQTEYTKSGNRIFKWKCQCDCGNIVKAVHSNLLKGATHSCGCLQRELASKRFSKHNLRDSRIYNVYANMKQRCCNPNNKRYKDYGGRGITICQEWLGDHGFENFNSWSISNNYSDDLTLDRIDNEKGYSPENCRWVTDDVQRNNQRKTIWVEIDGVKKNLKQWTNFMDWKYGKYSARYRRGAEVFSEYELSEIKGKIEKEKLT